MVLGWDGCDCDWSWGRGLLSLFLSVRRDCEAWAWARRVWAR